MEPIFVPPNATPRSASGDTFRWATVTDVSPVRIRLDGDANGLPLEPDSMMSAQALAVNDRVWCQFFGRRLIILGKSQGSHPPIENIKITDANEPAFAYSSAGWTFASNTVTDSPMIVADGRTVQISGRIRYSTAALSLATTYQPLYLPDRFAPIGVGIGGPRSILSCFCHGGANAVGPDMVAYIALDGSSRVSLNLFASSGTPTWTTSTWIYFGGTWIRQWPVPEGVT